MLGKLFARLSGLTGWLGSSVGSLAIQALLAVELKIRRGQVERATEILNLIEAVCMTVMDTVIYARGAIADQKLSGGELEDLYKMIRERIKDVSEAKIKLAAMQQR